MAEIGAALREARTRARIEIAQMEAQTKIRAKYLRALENEEWELLPGPTYVKSFLKTYGDMLGLDGRGLVAQYKSEHEPFVADDLAGQLSPKHTGGRTAFRQSRPPLWRYLLLGLIGILVIGGVAYAFLGGSDSPPDATNAVTGSELTGEAATDSTGSKKTPAATTATKKKLASVVVTATEQTIVCARGAKRQILNKKTLNAGQKTQPLRGQEIMLTLTNSSALVRVNGSPKALPETNGPVTVVIEATTMKRAGAATTACKS
jgi:cytoskeleton protein RodZ